MCNLGKFNVNPPKFPKLFIQALLLDQYDNKIFLKMSHSFLFLYQNGHSFCLYNYCLERDTICSSHNGPNGMTRRAQTFVDDVFSIIFIYCFYLNIFCILTHVHQCDMLNHKCNIYKELKGTSLNYVLRGKEHNILY